MPAPARPSTEALVERFLADRKGECAETYLKAQGYHLNRFKKFLRDVAKQSCDEVGLPDIERFLRQLKKTKDGESVNRYRVSLTQFYLWLAKQSDVAGFALNVTGHPSLRAAASVIRFASTKKSSQF